MITREFDVTIRLPQNGTQDTDIVLTQHDKDVYKFNVRVLDGLEEIDYSEVTAAKITFLKSDKNVVQGDMTKLADKLTYTLGTNEISCPGRVKVSVQLWGATERLTTGVFAIRVDADLESDSAVQSTSEFPILKKISDSAAKALVDYEKAIAGYQKMIQTSYIIPKAPVGTHDDIATVYPEPENGWTTRTLDTGRLYRYNAELEIWEWIDTVTESAYDAILNMILSEQTTPWIENTAAIFSTGTGKDPDGLDVDYNDSVVKGPLSATVRGNARINLLTENQSSAETDTTGIYPSPGVTLTRDTTEKVFGAACFKAVTDGSTATQGIYAGNVKGVNGKTYIGSAYIKAPAGTAMQFLIRREATATMTTKYFTGTGGWDRISATLVLDADTNDLRLWVRTQGTEAVTFYADGLMIEEADELRDFILGGGVKSTLPVVIRSVDSEEHEFSEAFVPVILRSLPNGVADEFDVMTGRHTQNVKEYALQASDIIALQNFTYIDTIIFNKPTDYLYASSALVPDSITVENFRFDVYSDDVSKIGVFYQSGTVTRIGLIVAKGTYGSLEEAKAGLAGTTLIYQLAEPNHIQLTPQVLNGYEKGTVYVYPAFQDTITYDSGSGGLVFNKPIQSIESIKKLDGYIDFTPTIASDGLSATVTELQNGDVVYVVAPYRPEASTTPTIIHKAPINEKAAINGCVAAGGANTKAIQQINETLAILIVLQT